MKDIQCLFKISIILFVSTTLISCTPMLTNKNYRYSDYGETNDFEVSKYKIKHPVLKKFPLYAAFSKSIYIDDGGEETRTLTEFCDGGEKAIFIPDGWVRQRNIKRLNERAKIHGQIGLKINIFKKTDIDNKSIVLIVFRGTDFDEPEDWLSNLRWFHKTDKLDQYDEVQELIPMLIEEILDRDSNIKNIIATGHSLGGGLAQTAGYSSHYINTVYAYDSSPVTGFYDIKESRRKFNSKNMKVYRINESGEILDGVRELMSDLYSVSIDDPKIIEVEFELIEEKENKGVIVGSIHQHDIKSLACKLNNLLK